MKMIICSDLSLRRINTHNWMKKLQQYVYASQNCPLSQPVLHHHEFQPDVLEQDRTLNLTLTYLSFFALLTLPFSISYFLSLYSEYFITMMSYSGSMTWDTYSIFHSCLSGTQRGWRHFRNTSATDTKRWRWWRWMTLSCCCLYKVCVCVIKYLEETCQ